MNSVDLMAIVSVWVCVWIICRHLVIASHRRYLAHLDARLENRRRYRAELIARRGPRIRGCICECHRLSAVR